MYSRENPRTRSTNLSSPRAVKYRGSGGSSHAPQLDEFRFVYYEDWTEGMNVKCKKNGKVVEMGTLLSKDLVGSQRDPDMVLTFSQDGVNTVHWVDFGATYLQY